MAITILPPKEDFSAGDTTQGQLKSTLDQLTDYLTERTNSAVDTGAANAYVMAPSPQITSYNSRQRFTFTTVNANTTNSTLSVSGLTAVAIKLPGGDELPPGTIQAGAVEVVHNGSDFTLVSSSSTNLAAPGPIGGDTPGAITGTVIKADTSLELASGATITEISTDTTMGGDSDAAVPTEKASRAFTLTSRDLAFVTAGETKTLALSDAHSIIQMSFASGITLTVPPNSSVAFPLGTQVRFYPVQAAGMITVTPGAGVTILSGVGLVTAAQYAEGKLTKTGTDQWIASGDLTP